MMVVKYMMISILLVGLFPQPAECTMKTAMLICLYKYGATTPYINFEPTKYGDEPIETLKKASMTLTDVGKRQMFNYGKYLLYSYPSFFENRLADSEVYMVASAAPRSIRSGSAVMLGLFNGAPKLETEAEDPILRPKFASDKNPSISKDPSALHEGWNSYPMFSTAEKFDRLLNLNSKDVCPNKNQLTSKKLKKTLNDAREVSREIKEIAAFYGVKLHGVDPTDIENCFYYFNLIAYHYYTKENPYFAPTGPRNETYLALKSCYEAYIMTLYGNETDLRMAGSPLALNISDHIDNYITPKKGSPTPKVRLYMYSVHEKSLIPLLAIMGLISRTCMNNRYLNIDRDNDCVGFPYSGSNLIIEVLLDDEDTRADSDSSKYLVRVKYNDEYMKVGDSEDQKYFSIPLNSFTQLLKEKSIEDWLVRCGINPPNELKIETDKWVLFLIISIAVIAVLTSFIFLYFWRSSTNPDKIEESEEEGETGESDTKLDKSII